MAKQWTGYIIDDISRMGMEGGIKIVCRGCLGEKYLKLPNGENKVNQLNLVSKGMIIQTPSGVIRADDLHEPIEDPRCYHCQKSLEETE